IAMLVCAGCQRDSATFTTVGHKIGAAGSPPAAKENELEAAQQPKAPKDPHQKATARPRKIRYTAELGVLVQDFEAAREGLNAAIKAADGLRETEEITTSAGTPRSGTWRIRVPVEQLDAFRQAVAQVGDVEQNTLRSEDMTAQYYDLEAHLKN